MSLWAIPTDYISKYCERAQCHCWVDGSTQWSESRGSTFCWCLRLGNMGMCTACAAYAYLWSMIYLCTLEQQRSCGNVIGNSRPLLHFNLHQICLVRRQPKLTWTQHANPHIFFNMKCECRTTNINIYLIHRWDTLELILLQCHFEQLKVAFLPHCIFVRTQQTLSGWNTIFR